MLYKKEYFMKVLYRIGLFLIVALGIYMTYHYMGEIQNLLPGSFEQNTGQQPPIIENITVDEVGGTPESTVDSRTGDIPVAGVGETLTCDTLYIVRELDKTTNVEELVEQQIPDQFIGKTRDQVVEIIEHYNIAPSLKDLERGFASMELSSFSKERLVVIKKYFSDMSKEHFYLIAENNYITVYYSDLATVYLYTDISLDALSETIQQEVLDKKYVESEEELYNFLESYTS